MSADQYGKLDVLENNAYVSRQKAFTDTTQEDFDLSFGTGFYPTFYLMKASFPYLKETKGSVINFASGSGLKGHKTQASYAATKEAIRAISRVAANEWAEFGINVNIISPIANTPGVEAWAKAQPEYYEAVKRQIPLVILKKISVVLPSSWPQRIHNILQAKRLWPMAVRLCSVKVWM